MGPVVRARRYAGGRLLVLCFAAVGVACNALTGLSDDYHLGHADAGAEAAGPSGDGGGPGQNDGSSDDASPPDATAGDGRACSLAADAEFCDDFEDDGDAGLVFRVESNASFTVAAAAGVDGSRGLDVVLPKTTSSSVNAWAAKALSTAAFPTTYAHYDVAYDFAVLQVDVFYFAAGILAFPGLSGAEYGVAVSNTGALLTAVNGNSGVAETGAGKWHHADIALDKVSGSTYARTIRVDGTVVEQNGSSAVGGSDVEIRLGTFATSSGVGTIHVRFDNVVVRRW